MGRCLLELPVLLQSEIPKSTRWQYASKCLGLAGLSSEARRRSWHRYCKHLDRLSLAGCILSGVPLLLLLPVNEYEDQESPASTASSPTADVVRCKAPPRWACPVSSQPLLELSHARQKRPQSRQGARTPQRTPCAIPLSVYLSGSWLSMRCSSSALLLSRIA